MTPFDYLKSINEGKDIMKTSVDEHEYNAFIVNMGLSLFPDTLFQSNEMNCNSHLTKYMQYKYLLNKIPPKKRFKKWPTKEKINGENIRLIQEIYKYNVSKAKQVLHALTDDELEWLKNKYKKGD